MQNNESANNQNNENNEMDLKSNELVADRESSERQ
jgi:hypothetical protein